MKKLRVLLADDHAVLRIGLVALIGSDRSLAVAGEAEDGEEAVAKAAELHPDVVIMDLMMPGIDGVEATRRILGTVTTAPRILILTTFAASDMIARALDAGASGALLKSSASSELLKAVHAVATGERYISEEVRELLSAEPPVGKLSERQQAVLDAAVHGLTNEQIAQTLGIGSDRVKQHLSVIYRKLGVANRSEAIAAAVRRNLSRTE